MSGVSAPPDSHEKRLRRTRRPVASADSASVRKTMQNASLQSFRDPFSGCSRARAVPGSNA
eukprot:15440388-Alexandrium_andersonii.AAC.1